MTEISLASSTPARYTAEIEGHTVTRTRTAWVVTDAAAIWAEVRETVPLGTGRVLHGTICGAAYWTGSFTQVQLDEYNRRIERLKRLARKARQGVQA